MSARKALRDADVPLLREVMRRVLAREVALDPETLRGILVQALTRREMAVFCLLGQRFKVVEMAQRLGVLPGTVKVYACQAGQKLGLGPAAMRRAAVVCWGLMA